MAIRLPTGTVIVGIAGLCMSTTSAGAPTDPVALDALDVVHEAPASTAPSPEEAAERLDRVPGGTTLIDEPRIREGRAAHMADALDGTPGVFSRSRFGGDELRLSIRGSGISRTFNTRGIRLLRDGLPVTEADGNTRTQLIDPLSARHIEVYRGANALGWGASTLGGAVNIVSPTGYTVPPLSLRAEAGSFGYGRAQGRAAWLGESGHDAVGSIAVGTEDGFRRQSAQETLRFYGNVGIQHSDRNQTRVHMDAQDSRLELPGSLTREEYRDDPRQAAAAWRAIDASRDLKLGRLAVQHHLRLTDADSLQLGAFVQHLRMDHPLPFAQIDSAQEDVGVSLRHVTRGRWLGRDNQFIWGLLAVTGRERQEQENRFSGVVTRRNNKASTAEIYAENTLELTSATALVAGMQLSWADREEDVRTGNAPEGRRIYRGASPRVGLLHQITPRLQIFGNLSRSLEPPINGELISEDASLVEQQRADTLEAGLRGRGERSNWEAVAYRAWLRDEILLVEDPNNPGDTLTSNADRTIHQGLELAGMARLPLDALTAPGDALEIGLAYTLNDFRFDGDRLWGNNRIPSIPQHVGRVDIRYRHARGFNIGPVIEAVSRTAVDFANSQYAPGHVLFGMRAGYHSPDGWRLFLDGRNLGDRRHVASTAIVARADPDSRVFNPGAPRSVFGGVEWTW